MRVESGIRRCFDHQADVLSISQIVRLNPTPHLCCRGPGITTTTRARNSEAQCLPSDTVSVILLGYAAQVKILLSVRRDMKKPRKANAFRGLKSGGRSRD